MTCSLFGGHFAGRRVLVTGHTGFKGSWLSEWLLTLGADVIGYALEAPTEPSLFEELGLEGRMRSVVGDVRDLQRLREVFGAERPEIVFHLAAQPLVRLSYDEPVDTYATNVMGTVNVLEAIRHTPGVRVAVMVTSDKCYENRETGQAYAEDDPLGGYDPYSSSKACAELVTSAYRRSFFGEGAETRIASVRAGNVIGGGDWALDRIVPDCVRALESGVPITVRNPDAVRPWQHVLEPLSGYLLLASRMWSGGHEFDGAWNFGPREHGTVPVRRVVEAMIGGWGSGSWDHPDGIRSVHEANLLALDIAKAREILGWAPIHSIERTFATTAAWYGARHRGADVRTITDDDISRYVDDARRLGAVWTTTGQESAEE